MSTSSFIILCAKRRNKTVSLSTNVVALSAINFYLFLIVVIDALCTIFTILLTFLKIRHFCYFVPKRHTELALKIGILVPKVAYDLPEFKIRP